MNFSFYIAKRYIFSKKSHNIINVISLISVIGVMVGTMALIIVLSVFNGFESVVISLFNSFDPDIKITAKLGKTFNPNEIPVGKIKKLNGVIYYTNVLEENALLKYRDKQYIATIKGVEYDFKKMSKLDTMMVGGSFILESDSNDFAVAGQGIAYFLSLNLKDFTAPLNIYVPRRMKTIENQINAFNNLAIMPAGVFSIQQDFDAKYVLVPLRFARRLLEYKEEVTAIEIGISKNADKENVQKEIQKLTGSGFIVENRYQQHKMLYKVMKNEKWAVFLILSFILVIATFNIIGSLTMLILEKKKDAMVLKSLGANNKLISRIFLIEGLMINLIGAIAGLALGALICLIQQKFGLIKIQATGTFVINTYPVELHIKDFIYVFITVFVIALLTSWYPVRQLRKSNFLDIKNLSTN
ncbi:MAG: FtsX-like permease family protein [Bacteroidales bacterium]|nr:FtsX-like permease family protein [Bacteroidales bacterium]